MQGLKMRSVGPARIEPVHVLRKTVEGRAFLEKTGRFRDYMRKQAPDLPRFIAWDGEGWTDRAGRHSYMLLQNSEGAYIHAPQLGSIDMLTFLLESASAAGKRKIHVGYGFGYDVTHILRDMPDDLKAKLLEDNEVVWSIPRRDGFRRNRFRIEYIPHKWFSVSGFDWKNGRQAYLKIYDVMTFFQSSFMNALTSRGIEIPEVIASGKASRADFTYQDLQEIRIYCQQELELLVQLCGQLRSEFAEAGIKVEQWHGPGAVANAIFKQRGIEEHKTPPFSVEFEKIVARAFHAGRFEQFGAGHYQGKVYVYDINSAYPHHISSLPSLKDAVWDYTEDYDPEAIGVWYCDYDGGGDLTRAHPIPWRSKTGAVGYPARVEGAWLWHPEAKFATRVHHGYILRHRPDVEGEGRAEPFGFVRDMYSTRQEWKRLGLGGEKALKLGMNSLFGKTCQSIGGNEKYGGRPRWHQLEWAGMITSNTRAQLWDAIQQAPDQIIAVETDSIASKVPLDLDIGPGLGQWELTEYDWITYIQSGIYFTSGENGARGKSKTRGIDVKQLDYDEVLEHLDNGGKTPLQVTTRMFIGLTNPRKYLYGQWQDSVKDVKIAGSKRLHLKHLCNACSRGESMATHLHTLAAAPHYGHYDSMPHKLPWLTDTAPQEDPEMQYVGTPAIEEYDIERRIRE